MPKMSYLLAAEAFQAQNFLSMYSDVRIDVLEIDPDVISAARDYFSLPVDNDGSG